ncbi:MAG TPA: Asp-tRNA(Asn)/Glu-tRNA(Gln) amidotransferase subunit GatC [Bacillota bacterium]|jgi:aspartyl-tRNA(Asn)/glutamyl-tRNA(Gln) amidotransferase subunit C
MPITKEDVRHVALLARLELDPKEVDRLAGQLGQILEHIAKMDALDTKDVEPTSHTLPSMGNVLRPDEVHRGLDREAALANAPSREGGFFKVPKVIEEQEG